MNKQELETRVKVYGRKKVYMLDDLLTECGNAKSLDQAIRLAGCSIMNDNCHPHQCRPGKVRCRDFADSLSNNITRIANCKDFDELHKTVASCKTPQIGDLTIYDVAHRIGVYMKIEPDKVYLHQGTWEGAKKLFGKRRLRKVMPIGSFPKPMHGLTAAQIEDMLCIEKDSLSEYTDWDVE